MDHMAILEEPERRFWRTLGFWGGLIIGFTLGTVAGTQF
jgi:hypothetical protein